MAATFLRSNDSLLSRLKLLLNQQRLLHTLPQRGLRVEPRRIMVPDSVAVEGSLSLVDTSKWKKMDARLFGIRPNMIPQSSWTVLKILQGQGFEAYLVGGCVRDLILKRVPKDFDVITTANLKEIERQFHRAVIIGQRFPICMVYIQGSKIEVSSFDTVAKHDDNEEVQFSQMPKACDKKDYIRWRNSMCRDFTINSLFFDPYSNKIYDYANGIADLRSLTLRSLKPAKLSFKEDCARILRGLRIAARLRLSISQETDKAIHKLSASILTLSKPRIMMEMNYMLSYGAAEPSLCLLWRFNLLKDLLPIHAAYLDEQNRRKSAQRSTMLMKLFSNLDKLVTCDRPSNCKLWIGLLAFHLALVKHPQGALTVRIFSSVLYHGGWKKGYQFALDDAQVINNFVPEISRSSALKSEEELKKEVSQLASFVLDSLAALTGSEHLIESMSIYPGYPCSGLVFVPWKMAQDVAEIFLPLANEINFDKKGRESFEIDYHLLGKGFIPEIRFVLSKIILETMNSEILKEEEVVQEEDWKQLLGECVKDNGNKGTKRGFERVTSQIKQKLPKRHKLVEKKSCVLEQEIAVDNQGFLETVPLPQKETYELHEEMEKTKKDSESKKVQSKRKKNLNMEEKAVKKQHCMPQDDATEQQLKGIKKLIFSDKETFSMESSVEDIGEKIPKDRQVNDKENVSLSLLSDKKKRVSEKKVQSKWKVDSKMGENAEKKQQCIPQDEATKQQLKTVKKHKLSKKTLNMESLQEDMGEKIPEDRQVKGKENVSLSPLSVEKKKVSEKRVQSKRKKQSKMEEKEKFNKENLQENIGEKIPEGRQVKDKENVNESPLCGGETIQHKEKGSGFRLSSLFK